MLDIKLIRENPDLVKENIKKKFQDQKLPLVDEVLELDKENRAVMAEAQELRSARNSLSKQVGILMGQSKKDPSKLAEAEEAKAKVKANADRLAELEAKERQYEAALQENERLRDFAGLRPSSLSFDPESATVTERSTSNWNSTLTISKGSSMGIAVDDVVVDQYWNLVGVVAEVGENWATVRTLVDVGTEMGGQIARTGGAAILEGDFALMGEGKLKLTYLPENSELMSGDLITTSGRGGVYPPGLAAGHVEEVRTDPSGMTRYAVLIPETDLAGLQQVFVIKDFEVVE